MAGGALAIVERTAQHGWRRRTPAGWLPFAGAVPFFVQTGVMDALRWPHFDPAV